MPPTRTPSWRVLAAAAVLIGGPMSVHAQGQQVRFSPPGSGFSIALPSAPGYAESGLALTLDMGAESNVGNQKYGLQDGPFSFGISYVDLPAAVVGEHPASGLFRVMYRRLLELYERPQIEVNQDLTLGSVPGHRLMVKFASGLEVDHYWYLEDHRLYQLVVEARAPASAADPKAAAVVDSFTLGPR